jgi:hypothetical protein
MNKTMKNLSVEKAISKGQLWVNLPAMIVMFGIMLVSGILADSKIIPLWAGFAGLISSFILAWLTWSFLITKWRIWAFSNVKNLKELHRKAVAEKLIWEKGHFLEKTEIRNKKEKELIEEFERKMGFQKHEYIPFKDDMNVPVETTIFYSQVVTFLGLIFSGILPLLLGSYFLYVDKRDWIFYLFVVGGFINCLLKYRVILNKTPQIILNKKGIFIEEQGFFDWYSVSCIEITSHDKLDEVSFVSQKRNFRKELNDLDITPEELKRLINIYTGRSSKSKTIFWDI